jgi:radical SAM/Cys-rich protein
VLNFVYNPVGAFLPPPQKGLESDFKRELQRKHGIVFNNLYTITNMPINRFKQQLKKLDAYDEYMTRLVNAYNPAAAEGVMCRSSVSVGYDGRIFDCDFNQMLDLEITKQQAITVFNFDYRDLIKGGLSSPRTASGVQQARGLSAADNHRTPLQHQCTQ